MDLLYVYDDKIACDRDGNYYTGSAFSQEIFDRYLAQFDTLTLVMRRAPVDPDDVQTLARMNRLTDARIRVVFYPDRRESLRAFLSLRRCREIRQIITRSITPERAVIVRVPSDAGTIAARFCRRIGKPFLAEAVGCPWDSLTHHSLRGKVLAPAAWLRMRWCMRHAPYAVYVTNAFLQRRYPTHGISAAISDVELAPVNDDVLVRRQEKIRDHTGKIVLGTAAAVNVAFKGQRYVIEALAQMKAAGRTDVEYHLAGGGDPAALRELARRLGVADQVIFEGSLPHDAVFPWLDGLDLYIQPSTVEAMPRALIEAMSRGLPCLASEVGAMPELLGDTCIFAKKDVCGIVHLLDTCTQERMTAMAEHNFAAAQAFEKETLARKRTQFYAAFAAAAKGAVV